jgi:hypothetical protein
MLGDPFLRFQTVVLCMSLVLALYSDCCCHMQSAGEYVALQ